MRRALLTIAGLGLLCTLAGLVALNLGPSGITLFSSPMEHTITAAILWETRLPRILLAGIVGAALGGAGTAYQALLRNPLADPYILGVSGGAALGSALAVAAALPFAGVVAAAFCISLGCMLAIYRLAARPGRMYTHALLLTGVVFNAFAFACILMIHALVPMERAQEILFLLMGNLALADRSMLLPAVLAVGTGMAFLLYRAQPLNALALGEETAQSLGVDLRRVQREVFFAGSLMISASVAMSGLIGFVGLFIPHAMRLLFGTDHRLLIPLSALGGAGFLIMADTVARALCAGATYQTELPVGVITALIGAPCFVYVLRKQL